MLRHRIHPREARYALQAQRRINDVLATLNTDALLTIRNEEVVKADRSLVDFKYFNIRPWIIENIKRALRLGLDDCRDQTILDIGTGFGFFPYVCEFMEHYPAALDIPGHRLYDRVIDALKIDRTTHVVNPFEPLPPPAVPFDCVTAYQVAFNRPNTRERWSVTEWAYFLDDILNHHVAPGGRLHLELNWSHYISDWCDTDTKKLFDSHGAIRVGNEVDIVKY